MAGPGLDRRHVALHALGVPGEPTVLIFIVVYIALTLWHWCVYSLLHLNVVRVDEHESHAREISGIAPELAPEHAAKTTALRYRPQSEFDLDDMARRREQGPFIGRADRWQDSSPSHLPGPGHYTAHEAWIDPTGPGATSAPSFGTPQYRSV